MKKEIFGCNVLSLDRKSTLNHIDMLLKSEKRNIQHVVLNASKTVMMYENSHLREIIRSCDIINADGQSIVWASSLLKKKLPERVTGIDLMEDLINLAAKEGYSVYFLGATEEVVSYINCFYQKKYPELKIKGKHHGYFMKDKNMEAKIISEINMLRPDILFVAFSSPYKEIWLNKWSQEIDYKFAMGVGGSFDVVAGKYKRAPKWMQNNGLEWLFRFLQEPKRMFRRYFYGNLKFLKILIKEITSQHRLKKPY